MLDDALHGVGHFFRRHALDAAIEAGLAAKRAAEEYNLALTLNQKLRPAAKTA